MRSGAPGDVRGVRLQDRAFGPGRVVLRKAGDLFEQIAATCVVEPFWLEPFGFTGQSHACVPLQRALGVVRDQVYVNHRFELGHNRPWCGASNVWIKRRVNQTGVRSNRGPIEQWVAVASSRQRSGTGCHRFSSGFSLSELTITLS